MEVEAAAVEAATAGPAGGPQPPSVPAREASNTASASALASTAPVPPCRNCKQSTAGAGQVAQLCKLCKSCKRTPVKLTEAEGTSSKHLIIERRTVAGRLVFADWEKDAEYLYCTSCWHSPTSAGWHRVTYNEARTHCHYTCKGNQWTVELEWNEQCLCWRGKRAKPQGSGSSAPAQGCANGQCGDGGLAVPGLEAADQAAGLATDIGDPLPFHSPLSDAGHEAAAHLGQSSDDDLFSSLLRSPATGDCPPFGVYSSADGAHNWGSAQTTAAAGVCPQAPMSPGPADPSHLRGPANIRLHAPPDAPPHVPPHTDQDVPQHTDQDVPQHPTQQAAQDAPQHATQDVPQPTPQHQTQQAAQYAPPDLLQPEPQHAPHNVQHTPQAMMADAAAALAARPHLAVGASKRVITCTVTYEVDGGDDAWAVKQHVMSTINGVKNATLLDFHISEGCVHITFTLLAPAGMQDDQLLQTLRGIDTDQLQYCIAEVGSAREALKAGTLQLDGPQPSITELPQLVFSSAAAASGTLQLEVVGERLGEQGVQAIVLGRASEHVRVAAQHADEQGTATLRIPFMPAEEQLGEHAEQGLQLPQEVAKPLPHLPAQPGLYWLSVTLGAWLGTSWPVLLVAPEDEEVIRLLAARDQPSSCQGTSSGTATASDNSIASSSTLSGGDKRAMVVKLAVMLNRARPEHYFAFQAAVPLEVVIDWTYDVLNLAYRAGNMRALSLALEVLEQPDVKDMLQHLVRAATHGPETADDLQGQTQVQVHPSCTLAQADAVQQGDEADAGASGMAVEVAAGTPMAASRTAGLWQQEDAWGVQEAAQAPSGLIITSCATPELAVPSSTGGDGVGSGPLGVATPINAAAEASSKAQLPGAVPQCRNCGAQIPDGTPKPAKLCGLCKDCSRTPVKFAKAETETHVLHIIDDNWEEGVAYVYCTACCKKGDRAGLHPVTYTSQHECKYTCRDGAVTFLGLKPCNECACWRGSFKARVPGVKSSAARSCIDEQVEASHATLPPAAVNRGGAVEVLAAGPTMLYGMDTLAPAASPGSDSAPGGLQLGQPLPAAHEVLGAPSGSRHPEGGGGVQAAAAAPSAPTASSPGSRQLPKRSPGGAAGAGGGAGSMNVSTPRSADGQAGRQQQQPGQHMREDAQQASSKRPRLSAEAGQLHPLPGGGVIQLPDGCEVVSEQFKD